MASSPAKKNFRQFRNNFVGQLFLALLLLPGLSACQSIKLDSTGKNQPGKGASSTVGAKLAGNWQVSWELNGQTNSSHMSLAQDGTGFQGKGTEDNNKQDFVIDTGLITGNNITFHKRYHVEENPNLAPIVYQGTFQELSTAEYTGPYLSGTYQVTKGNRTIEGKWDAQKEGYGPGGQPQAAPQTSPQPTPEPNAAHNSNKAPHLSGKWDAGYEFEFKTVRSTIYLEQDGTKIVGHGMDKATKEAFKISGNYKFPNIKLWLKYLPVKAAKGVKAKPERSLEFRGTAAVVNESEYQGARLEGKTNGGGAWMAEQVR
jgi:hypothetical protein